MFALMKKGRIILMIILLAILIAVPVIYTMYNKPPDKVEDIEGVKVSVAQLADAYAADEAKANETYLNKAVIVTGVVSEVQNNQDGKLLIVLEDKVQCTLREKDAKAQAGNTITVKAFCTGSSLFGVVLSDGIIVN